MSKLKVQNAMKQLQLD